MNINPPKDKSPWWGYKHYSESYDSVWNGYKMADTDLLIDEAQEYTSIHISGAYGVDIDTAVVLGFSRAQTVDFLSEVNGNINKFKRKFEKCIHDAFTEAKRRKLDGPVVDASILAASTIFDNMDMSAFQLPPTGVT
jgi:hypothetical protein